MLKALLACLLLATGGAVQASTVTPLLTKDLASGPDKEGVMMTVELAPGEESPVHRHNANVFVYVLSGTIIMQVQGGPRVTLEPGETFYEEPTDIHVIGSNASKTEPAKFIAFFVTDKGAPAVIPVH